MRVGNTTTTSLSNSVAAGSESKKGFGNPAFEKVDEETDLKDDNENPDLLDVDEEMFENPKKEGSLSNLSFDMQPEASDKESGKWNYTVTFNWARKNRSTETLDNDEEDNLL